MQLIDKVGTATTVGGFVDVGTDGCTASHDLIDQRATVFLRFDLIAHGNDMERESPNSFRGLNCKSLIASE